MHAKERKFRPGQRVLVLLPTSTTKLLMQWQGTLEIIHRVGPIDYEVHRPEHWWEKQIYHIYLLREWHKPEGWATFTESEMEDLRPQSMANRKPKTQAEDQVQIGEKLSTHQRDEMKVVVQDFKDVFSEELGWVWGTTT